MASVPMPVLWSADFFVPLILPLAVSVPEATEMVPSSSLTVMGCVVTTVLGTASVPPFIIIGVAVPPRLPYSAPSLLASADTVSVPSLMVTSPVILLVFLMVRLPVPSLVSVASPMMLPSPESV